MAEQILSIASLDELQILAEKLGAQIKGGQLWCFSGELGSGKTELIRRIVHISSPGERVTSPSFNLENRYPLGDLTACHWDLYRLGKIRDLPDLDEQIGNPEILSLVEWPERYPGLEARADIFITLNVIPGTETREIRIKIAK